MSSILQEIPCWSRDVIVEGLNIPFTVYTDGAEGWAFRIPRLLDDGARHCAMWVRRERELESGAVEYGWGVIGKPLDHTTISQTLEDTYLSIIGNEQDVIS